MLHKSWLLVLCLLAACAVKSQAPSFTISNLSSSYSITCANPIVTLTAASDYTNGPVTYSWVNPGVTLTGTQVIITTPGPYTVTAYASPTLSSTQTIVIGVNVMPPSSTLTPQNQTITCNPAAIFSHTAQVDPGMEQMWLTPEGGTVYASPSPTAIFTPGGPGTYIHVATDPVNGCSAVKAFTVTSVSAFPSFSLAPMLSGFMLGCSFSSVTAVSIANAFAQGFPVSYTLLAPGASTVLPAGNLAGFNTYTMGIPGVWTAVTRNNSTGCETRSSFSVVQNTTSPVISVSASTTQACQGEPVTLTASGAHTYTFTGGVSQNVPFFPASTKSYSITGTSTINLCTGTTSILVTVLSPPSVTPVASAAVVCPGKTVSLSGTGTDVYHWSHGVINGQAFTPTSTAVYTVTGTSNLTGCSKQATVSVPVWTNPSIGVTGNSPAFCSGAEHTLTAMGADTYNWSSGQTGPFVTVSPSSTSVYTVSGTNSYGCTGTASYTIPVAPSGTFNYTLNGMELRLENTGGCSSLLWNFGNGNTSTLSASQIVNYASAGSYTVCLKCTGSSLPCEKCIVISAPGNFSGGVGIKEHAAGETFLVYPNPAEGWFVVHCSSEKQRLILLNSIGQIVLEKELRTGDTPVEETLPAGIYYYRVAKGGWVLHSGKLILK